MIRSDRPTLEEIEVMPEMIQAGMNYWINDWGYQWPESDGAVRDFFRDLYRAIALGARR